MHKNIDNLLRYNTRIFRITVTSLKNLTFNPHMDISKMWNLTNISY